MRNDKLNGVAFIASLVLAMGFSFAALGDDCYWEKGVYDSSATFVKPVDRITCNADGGMFDDDFSTGSGGQNSTLTYSWDEPQDIDYIELYDKGASSWAYNVTSVSVKYSGDEDYTLLSGSALAYTENADSMKMSTLRGSGGALAENIVGIQIVLGEFGCSWAHTIAELVFHGKAHGSTVRWDYAGLLSADELTHPDDVLTNDLVTLTGFGAIEHDDSLSANSERGDGSTWTWDFSRPHDIRTIEFWGYNQFARSRFRIKEVRYKRSGDAGYTTVVGSYLGYFGYENHPGHRAILSGDGVSSDCVVDNVVSLQLVLGTPVNAYVECAEVRCTGYESIQPNPQWEVTKDGSQAYISDGVWKFKATLTNNRLKNLDGTYRTTGPYAMTVGDCTAYPPAVTPLDFSKPVTNAIPGETKEYAINEIYTRLGTWTKYSNNRIFSSTAAGEVAGKLTLPAADYQFIINEQAFTKCEHIDFDFADLPSGLVRLGNNAFAEADVRGDVDCTYLNYVGTHVFAKNYRLGSFKAPLVTELGDSSFWRSGVTSVNVGDVLKRIDGCAFDNCTNLVSFTPFLPQTCKTVGRGAFNACYKLASPLVFYGGNNSSTLVNNSSDWEIFLNCWSLPSADLSHSTIKFLTRNSFVNCYSLEWVKLPDCLESLGCVFIGNQAGVFANCTNLTTVTPFIPDSVTNIATSTFSNCPKLRGKLKMLGVTDIGLNAANNSGIDEVEFGPNLKRLWCAFYPSPNLSKITSPKNLKGVVVDGQGFRDCPSLTGTVDMHFASMFGGSMFRGCPGVNELILGPSLTNVSGSAFYAMSGLRSVKWQGDKPTTIGDKIFNSCGYQMVTNYVPKAYAANWQAVVTDGSTLGYNPPSEWNSGQKEWICIQKPSIGFIWLAD